MSSSIAIVASARRFFPIFLLVSLASACGNLQASHAKLASSAVDPWQGPRMETRWDVPAGYDKSGDEIRQEISAVFLIASRGNVESAIIKAEELRKRFPQEARYTVCLSQLLSFRARELANDARIHEALTVANRAISLANVALADDDALGNPALKRELAQNFFEIAKTLAVAGRANESINVLSQALDWGLENCQRMLTAPELVSVRSTDGFRDLVARAPAMANNPLDSRTLVEIARFRSFPFDFALPPAGAGATGPVSLRDFHGKVTVVTFWGTWCAPCRAELPSLIHLKNEYGKQGLEIVGLAYPQDELDQASVDEIRHVMQSSGLNYPCLLGDEATKAQLPVFPGYPTMLFLDREGTVRLAIAGEHPYEKIESICRMLLDEGE